MFAEHARARYANATIYEPRERKIKDTLRQLY